MFDVIRKIRLIRRLPNSRTFSSSFRPLTQEIRVKHRLHVAVKKNVNPDRNIRHTRRRERFIQKKNMRPVKNASAVSLLEEMLGRKLDTVEVGPLTPFSEEDMMKIFTQRNNRLKYRILGTSGNQLKDSLIVDTDVTKFLERDDITRSIWMVRLARSSGLFGYGTILKYMLKNQKYNAALTLFTDLKKRGLTPDGRVLNILFSGFADRGFDEAKKTIPEEKAERLNGIFLREVHDKNSEVSVIHVNSLLKCFRAAHRPDLALKIFDVAVNSKQKQLKPDVRTYTEMFSNLKLMDDYDVAIEQAEKLFNRVQLNSAIKIDSRLITAYSSLFVFSNDARLCARAITILREWYRICSKDEIKQVINWKDYDHKLLHNGSRKLTTEDVDPTILLPLSKVNLNKTKRFDPDDRVIRRYAGLCLLFKIEDTYKA